MKKLRQEILKIYPCFKNGFFHQGYFKDSHRYDRWTQQEKQQANKDENLIVKMGDFDGLQICMVIGQMPPLMAEVIADALTRYFKSK